MFELSGKNTKIKVIHHSPSYKKKSLELIIRRIEEGYPPRN